MRVFLIVLDSVGAGALPDAAQYGDVGANTLLHVLEAENPNLPNLKNMGLCSIDTMPCAPPADAIGVCRPGHGKKPRQGYHHRPLGNGGRTAFEAVSHLPRRVPGRP